MHVISLKLTDQIGFPLLHLLIMLGKGGVGGTVYPGVSGICYSFIGTKYTHYTRHGGWMEPRMGSYGNGFKQKRNWDVGQNTCMAFEGVIVQEHPIFWSFSYVYAILFLFGVHIKSVPLFVTFSFFLCS